MKEFYGDIEITLASELTKIHQSVKIKKLSEWSAQFSKKDPRGEYILLLNLSKD